MFPAKVASWLKALRLKFYPMSWVAYAIGALLVVDARQVLTSSVFWLGLGFIFFLEVATVLSNEYFDFESDRQNTFAGPFSGGSRVLVNNELSHREILAGIWVALACTVIFLFLTVHAFAGAKTPFLLLAVVLVILALGYTVPPLKFSYRSLGEIDVGITDSIGVMLCGYILFGGAWNATAPWLLSVPLFLAFIPSITLCAVPDFAADRIIGKRTLAVRFGIHGAAAIAGVTAVLASVSAVLIQAFTAYRLYGNLIYLSVLHSGVLVMLLYTTLKNQREACRIDTLMIVSLSLVLWFGVLPLLKLVTG